MLISGEFRGDGRAKAVAFPDPERVAVVRDDVALLPIERFVELKLASELSSIHRLKDLGDVVELVKAAKLTRTLGDDLHESVRDKHWEIWDAVQTPDPYVE